MRTAAPRTSSTDPRVIRIHGGWIRRRTTAQRSVLEEIRSLPGVVHARAAPRLLPVEVAGVTAA
jgi:hypothetical protein